MAKEDIAPKSSRSPRGAKPVSQAFFTALESIPEATRAAVAKAALAMIRDDMKAMREKAKLLAAKEKARKPSVAKTAVKAKVAQPKKQAATKAKARPTAKAGITKAVEVPEAA